MFSFELNQQKFIQTRCCDNSRLARDRAHNDTPYYACMRKVEGMGVYALFGRALVRNIKQLFMESAHTSSISATAAPRRAALQGGEACLEGKLSAPKIEPFGKIGKSGSECRKTPCQSSHTQLFAQSGRRFRVQAVLQQHTRRKNRAMSNLIVALM